MFVEVLGGCFIECDVRMCEETRGKVDCTELLEARERAESRLRRCQWGRGGRAASRLCTLREEGSF